MMTAHRSDARSAIEDAIVRAVLDVEPGDNDDVDHVDLTVREGEVLESHGPNGAGETSTLPPDSRPDQRDER
jgi:ABC-type hemin transport system ATPase subunit